MSTSSGNPFSYSSTMAQNSGAGSSLNNPSRMALDNLIRRELKVNDPNDAKQVAEALLTRYKDNPRTAAITREAQGVPFLLSTPMASPMPQVMRSSDTEWQQAVNDIENDLQALTQNAILKDVRPELQGWAMAIRSAIADGVNAARYALDTRRRDVAFGIRRTLGDYARMARLVGILTPGMNINYRKLAQSLDEAASVLLVMMGEALANIGFNGGQYLLQAPFSELQARRDAVIFALRNLNGSTQEAYDSNNWPRGLDAYRQLFSFLEAQGQGDLRALLVETELMRIMDALVHRSGQGSVDGLRQLGATAQLDVERLRRFVILASNAIQPASPPLIAFLEALQLFVDAFDSAGGSRLLKIARPPVLFYGLYGTSGLDSADRRLLEIIIQRGLLADQLDCFAQCGCDSNSVKCQIVLDKILYDIDRAIDLYAVGQANFGQPEQRAGAYGYVIEAFLIQAGITTGVLDTDPPELPPFGDLDSLGGATTPNPTQLGCLNPLISSPTIATKIRNALRSLYNQLLPIDSDGFNPNIVLVGIPPVALDVALEDLNDVDRIPTLPPRNPNDPNDPVTLFRNLATQELQIQKDMEQRWQNLVKSMAADCVPFENTQALVSGTVLNTQSNIPRSSTTQITDVGVFGVTTQVLNEAIRLANGLPPTDPLPTLNPQLIALPNQYEFGIQGIIDAINDNNGSGYGTP
jgi:hypothetical protein